MKKRKITALFLSVLLLATSLFACGQSEQDRKFDAAVSAQKAANEEARSALEARNSSTPSSSQPEETTKEGKHLSGELRISLPLENTVMEGWISKFKKEYPDVDINLEYTAPNVRSIPDDYASKYTKTTLAELASGEAADIIDLTLVSFYKYGKTGLFEDFNELMEKDEDFDRQELYTNVLDALESDDQRLYVMPTNFRPSLLVLNDYIMDDLGIDAEKEFSDGVEYNELIDLFWRAMDEGHLRETSYFAPKWNKFFFEGFCIPDFLDEKTGEARFDTPEFIEYLEKTNALPFENTIQQGFDFDPNLPQFAPSDYFCQQVILIPSYLDYYYTTPLPGNTKAFLYKSENGKVPFSTASHLAIPKGGNVELAWEFIKFMIEEKEFPDKIDVFGSPEDIRNYVTPYGSAIPIHRENCRKLYTAALDKTVAEEVDKYNQMLNTRSGNSTELMENLKDIFISYYDNHLISAEECARQLQERAWIYLNE